MKQVYLSLVVYLWLVTGCGPSPEAIATQTATTATAIAAAWTATPTATPTFTPTPTQTFTPTATPTPTLTPTATPTLTSTPVPPTATSTTTSTPTNTPTFTPVPPTATPTPLPGPQAGHWEGEPSVSFEVTADGDIRDFKIVIPITGVGTCTITLNQIGIEADGTFLEGELDPDGTLKQNSIRGKFDNPTTLTGAYSKLLFCGNTMSMSSEEGTWGAEWQGP